MSPTITVLVPAYNAALHIDACLRSVLCQMDARHTLIVIDDGSTDGTAQQIDALRAAWPAQALTLIRQTNQGLSITRNRLLEAATGEYILFLDADDLLRPGVLAALDQIIDTQGPDAIVCDFNDWHPAQMRRTHTITRSYPAATLIQEREQILRSLFVDRLSYAWANVLRRSVYARQSAPLYPPGWAFEDVTVTPQLLADCASLVRLAQAIIDYRQHPGTMKRNVSYKWCIDFATALRDRYQECQQRSSAAPFSAALHMQMDASTVHHTIVILKASYELSWRDGKAARAGVLALLAQSLFHPVEAVLQALESGTLKTLSGRADLRAARQMRQLLAARPGFVLARILSRQIKAWRRWQQLRSA